MATAKTTATKAKATTTTADNVKKSVAWEQFNCIVNGVAIELEIAPTSDGTGIQARMENAMFTYDILKQIFTKGVKSLPSANASGKSDKKQCVLDTIAIWKGGRAMTIAQFRKGGAVEPDYEFAKFIYESQGKADFDGYLRSKKTTPAKLLKALETARPESFSKLKAEFEAQAQNPEDLLDFMS